jgi:hypothetical protein
MDGIDAAGTFPPMPPFSRYLFRLRLHHSARLHFRHEVMLHSLLNEALGKVRAGTFDFRPDPNLPNLGFVRLCSVRRDAVSGGRRKFSLVRSAARWPSQRETGFAAGRCSAGAP